MCRKALFFVLLLAFAPCLMAQNMSISMKNVKLKDFFNQIESQYSYTFMYTNTGIDDSQTITVEETNVTLETLLNKTLSTKGIAYEISGKQILLTAKKEAVASNLVITGKVLDSKGEPVPMTNVLVKGTQIGVLTDMDGGYSITVPAGTRNPVLLYSFIGFLPKEEAVGSRNVINATMEDEISKLSEAVVVGYGTVQKKDLTSAVTTIRSKDMLQGAFNNPMQMVDGKVAGVSISSTAAADPNASSTIQVRGAGSIDAGNGPLIVIDGMPGGDLRNISQQDIESITFLKDGSAAAIYGSRAANGVVLIQSKRGRSGKVSLTYDAYLDKDFVSRKPKLLTADQYVEHNRGTDNGSRTDWYDALIRDDNFGQNHFVSASGGNENTVFRISSNFKKKSGIDIASDRKEYGLRANFMQKALDGLLELGGNISYKVANEEYTNYEAFKQAMEMNPTNPIYDAKDITGYKTFVGQWDTWNPVQHLKERELGSDQTYSTIDFNIKLNLHKDFNTEVKLARQARDQFKREYWTTKSQNSIDGGYKGSAKLSQENWADWTFEWLGNYAKRIDKHDIKLMAGYSYQELNQHNFWAENKDFPSDGLWYNNLQAGTWMSKSGQVGMESGKSKEKTIAFFGRANYSFDDTYLFTATYRHEGNTKFGPDQKWGGFPAASFAWRFSKLDYFQQSAETFNDLKLRVSYGETGRSGFGRYKSQLLYSPAGWWQNEAGTWVRTYGPGNTPNPDLHWEKQKSYNLGLDFVLFKSRLSGSFDAFIKKGKDVISDYDVPVPPNLFDKITTNVASTTAKGFELQFEWQAIKQENFTYSISFTGSYVKSILDKFSNGTYTKGFTDKGDIHLPGGLGSPQRLADGLEIGTFRGYKYAGVDEVGNMLIWANGQEGTTTKKSYDGSDEDKTYMGNGAPKYEMSFGHNITYKSFDLGLFFRGRFKYQILNVNQMAFGLQATPEVNLLEDAYTRNGHITSPKAMCDYFLENGNFFKLDNISFGWTPNLGEQIGKYVKNARLYASVRNVFTITKYTGPDPSAVDVSGLEPGIGQVSAYPVTRSFTVGIQVTF